MRCRPGRAPSRLRAAGLFIAGAGLLASGCGPTTPLKLTVRDEAINVHFGAQNAAAGHRPAGPAATLGLPVSGFGPITAPVQTNLPPAVLAAPPRSPVTGTVLPPAPLCPSAPPGTPAQAAAPTTVTGPPKAGVYRYLRVGSLVVGAPGASLASLSRLHPNPLSTEVIREVTNVKSAALPGAQGPLISFDVAQIEPGVRTTTSFEVVPVGASVNGVDVGLPPANQASPGLKITKIVLQRAGLPGPGPGGSGSPTGEETFQPNPPIKIMDLPAQPEPAPQGATDGSLGADPTSGAQMDAYQATQDRINIDLCGVVIQGWEVRVSFPALTSYYNRSSVRNYQFSGEFIFAPQYSLIVQDHFIYRGVDVGGRPYEMDSDARLMSLTPV